MMSRPLHRKQLQTRMAAEMYTSCCLRKPHSAKTPVEAKPAAKRSIEKSNRGCPMNSPVESLMDIAEALVANDIGFLPEF